MTQEVSTQKKTGIAAIAHYLNGEGVSKKFETMMGKRATQFITSVLHVCSNNEKLKNADPISVYQSAAVAATLDLPLNSNLGFAYIVPYNETRDAGEGRTYSVTVAQFQMGYKGFIQLAQRSGQFRTINVTDVRDGEIKRYDRLTGDIEFQWIENDKERLSKSVIGYASFFKLLNGFEKTFYMSIEKIHEHGKRYSKTYSHKNGRWILDFEGMAMKTVIKLLLSKYAPLSVETIQSALIFDQATIKDFEKKEVEYPDAEEVPVSAIEINEAVKEQVEVAKENIKEAKKGKAPLTLL